MPSFIHNLREVLEGHGHDCTCDNCMEEHHHHHHGFDVVMIVRLSLAALLFIGGMLSEDPAPVLSFLLFLFSMLVSGYDVLIGAVVNIIHKKLFDECLLMTIVAVAAVIIGETEEGASVLLLFQIGELFQGFAVAKVRQNIESLIETPTEETQKVLNDVRADRGEKGRTEEFITAFCRIYTPVVLALALVFAVISLVFLHETPVEAVYRSLVVMVIACPCAIVISVPLSYFAGIGGASRAGILFKNTGAMDAVSHTKAIIFDKSGIFDDVGLRVLNVSAKAMDADTILRIAAHASAFSSETWALAIRTAYNGPIYIELIQCFEEDENRGIHVKVDNVDILLGTTEQLQTCGLSVADASGAKTCIHLVVDTTYTGSISFVPVTHPESAEAVSALAQDRDREIALLSEESTPTTETLAGQLGIQNYYPECAPDDKIAVLRDMKDRCHTPKGTLIFIGNAAEAGECLQEADVGLSLGGSDSEEAILKADVVIMDRSPLKVAAAISAARHTRSIVWQNIGFALGFKLLILCLDFFGCCPLWLAVFADVGVALLAVLNSLRAFSFRKQNLLK